MLFCWQDFRVNASSSSEQDVSEKTQLKLDLSSFTTTSSQLGNDSSSLLNTAVFVPSIGKDTNCVINALFWTHISFGLYN